MHNLAVLFLLTMIDKNLKRQRPSRSSSLNSIGSGIMLLGANLSIIQGPPPIAEGLIPTNIVADIVTASATQNK